MSRSTPNGPHPGTATERDPRWTAVVARDRQADGTFYYSVETTGVYCRPSCASRRANPRNVRFHRTRLEAERAGFRPCKRCRPDQPRLEDLHAAKVADVCRMIEQASVLPSLAALARRAHLSPHHFHRVFKAVTGVTPRAYGAAHRARRLQRALKEKGKTVTETIYQAGFNSTARFYETADALLGMTPTEYRDGAPGTRIQFAVGQCSLGFILVARTAKGVCAILLGDRADRLRRDLEDRFPRAAIVPGDAAFESTMARVIALVESPARGLDLPLDVRGTAFQRRVWEALRDIPAGATASYSEIAARIGAGRGARAVARACAANALAVAIPCHRVVNADGALSGYRWGVERKRKLIEKESLFGQPSPRPSPRDAVRRRRGPSPPRTRC